MTMRGAYYIMIDNYRDLVLETEIQILNHALVDKYHLEEVKGYKFQRPELKPLFEEIQDIQANNYEPVIQALWDKYPIVYGRLIVQQHSNIKAVLSVARRCKARIYLYDKVTTHLANIATDTQPLEVVIDKMIADLRTVRGAL